MESEHYLTAVALSGEWVVGGCRCGVTISAPLRRAGVAWLEHVSQDVELDA